MRQKNIPGTREYELPGHRIKRFTSPVHLTRQLFLHSIHHVTTELTGDELQLALQVPAEPYIGILTRDFLSIPIRNVAAT